MNAELPCWAGPPTECAKLGATLVHSMNSHTNATCEVHQCVARTLLGSSRMPACGNPRTRDPHRQCRKRHTPNCSCKHKAPTRTHTVMHTCSSHTPKLVLVQRVQAAACTRWRCMPQAFVPPHTHSPTAGVTKGSALEDESCGGSAYMGCRHVSMHGTCKHVQRQACWFAGSAARHAGFIQSTTGSAPKAMVVVRGVEKGVPANAACQQCAGTADSGLRVPLLWV